MALLQRGHSSHSRERVYNQAKTQVKEETLQHSERSLVDPNSRQPYMGLLSNSGPEIQPVSSVRIPKLQMLGNFFFLVPGQQPFSVVSFQNLSS